MAGFKERIPSESFPPSLLGYRLLAKKLHSFTWFKHNFVVQVFILTLITFTCTWVAVQKENSFLFVYAPNPLILFGEGSTVLNKMLLNISLFSNRKVLIWINLYCTPDRTKHHSLSQETLCWYFTHTLLFLVDQCQNNYNTKLCYPLTLNKTSICIIFTKLDKSNCRKHYYPPQEHNPEKVY